VVRVCCVCGERTIDHYMVKSSTWKEAGFVWTDIVCLECLQRRLVRPLTIKDFKTCPINNSIRLGYKLGKEGR